nr:MAG TPA: hypothetical protein [Caudoviricetes sp.]
MIKKRKGRRKKTFSLFPPYVLGIQKSVIE